MITDVDHQLFGDGTASREFLPDKNRAIAQARAGLAAWCDLLMRTPDLDVPAVGTWSVRDLAGHFAYGLPFYARMVAGGGSPVQSWADMAAFNETGVRTVEVHDA